MSNLDIKNMDLGNKVKEFESEVVEVEKFH